MFCFHKWKIIGQKKFLDISPIFGKDGHPCTSYHLQCEKCGDLKEKTLLMQMEQNK